MGLTEYVFRRILYAIPILLVVTIFVFSILHLAPGDPVQSLVSERMGKKAMEKKREELGLNDPIYVQYLSFMKDLFTGKVYSHYRSKNVFSILGSRLPNTLRLTLFAFVISYIVAIPAGILAAIHRGSAIDSLAMIIALIGLAMPQFWLGLILIIVFAGQLEWFPVGGYGSFRALILPGITLGFYGAALTARITRSSILEVLQKDYITTARSKGLMERVVLFKHALRNALMPILSVMGLRLGWLVGGAVVIETVFSRPGIGRLLVNSVYQKDYPVCQVVILMISAAVIFGNIFADIMCAIVDPKIRYE